MVLSLNKRIKKYFLQLNSCFPENHSGYQENHSDEADSLKFGIIQVLPEFNGCSANSDSPIILNDFKLKYSESATLHTSETTIKQFKMRKFQFSVFSRK